MVGRIPTRLPESEAIEVSLRSGDAARSPIYVIRGYPDGRLEFATAATAADQPKTAEPASIRYQAKVIDPSLWQAELAIPWDMIDHDPAAKRPLWFN
ncbi:MAG: hypothetical protein K8H88_31740, partial [Sandaracinaceae bacterium]|nr:hypothetical protein [Sandaracinaceae bacterium]